MKVNCVNFFHGYLDSFNTKVISYHLKGYYLSTVSFYLFRTEKSEVRSAADVDEFEKTASQTKLGFVVLCSKCHTTAALYLSN